MGIPVLILGESGSGKSTSLRQFAPEEIGIFNVASKPLPFRKQMKVINRATYDKIKSRLPHRDELGQLPKDYLRAFAIDDSQYLLAFEFFDRAKETGYNKFTDIALHFRDLIQFVITQTPEDCIVYFLHHTESGADGTLKAKTIGKMLERKPDGGGAVLRGPALPGGQGQARVPHSVRGIQHRQKPPGYAPRGDGQRPEGGGYRHP